jgi:uncharacterized membrane protein YbhN (UPF0104 family)
MGASGLAWVVLGVLVHLTNQLARAQGWYAVIRAACPAEPVRRRDALAAWVGGAGAAGVLSARGGDAIRIVLLRPHAPDAGCPRLAGTLVAEAAGDAAIGAALLAVAATFGLGPGVGLPAPALLGGAAVLLLAASAIRPVRRLAAGVAAGACALRSPGRYAYSVLPWQALSRLARGAAIACFLVAFGLPATVPAVLLVMLAQGGGRMLPFAPASVGAGVAILAAAFAPVTGTAVDPARLAAFYLVTSAVLTGVGIVLAVVVAARVPVDHRIGLQPVAAFRRWLAARSPSRQAL